MGCVRVDKTNRRAVWVTRLILWDVLEELFQGTWLVHICHTLFICVKHESCHKCDMTHTVGCYNRASVSQEYPSFAEYRLFYRAFLQKRPIILSILLATDMYHNPWYIYICMYTHIYVYMYTHMYMSSHIYMYTHTYIPQGYSWYILSSLIMFLVIILSLVRVP